MIGIYKITSPSGRIYIGQSIDIEKRWAEYLRKDCKTQIKLSRSFKKYGVKGHIFEIIEECEIGQLNIRERYWQDFYNCMEKGLNCLLTQTDEKPQVISKETRRKLRLKNLGKKLSDETKLKMSLSKLGRKNTEEHQLKLTEKLKKKIIDTVTNKIYLSMKEAAEDINITYSSFRGMLNGQRKNKTTCRYLEEWSLYNQ
jgi:group I intron endonuclease